MHIVSVLIWVRPHLYGFNATTRTFILTINNLIAAAAACALAAAAGSAQALVSVNISQSGADVVVSASGSLNLADLSDREITEDGGGLIANDPGFENRLSAGQGGTLTPYSGDIARSSTKDFIVNGGYLPADSATSGYFGIEDNLLSGVYFTVSSGYASGSWIATSSTYANTTLAALGLNPGTWNWTWGSGATADGVTLTVQGIAPAVPEPASAALLLAGGLACAAWRRRGGRA